ncbi:MAG: helix-turn-helix transcriptional regulator [Bacteroidales bacterium]|jgi:transcriptional regulator with XRE-family HTH domain
MEKTFGQLFRELRRSRSVSQRYLAEKVGVDFSYISKIENDRLPPPSADTIEKISSVLEIPNEILLSYSGKVSQGIKALITSKPEVVKFLNEVKQLNLTSSDWENLTTHLKSLK